MKKLAYMALAAVIILTGCGKAEEGGPVTRAKGGPEMQGYAVAASAASPGTESADRATRESLAAMPKRIIYTGTIDLVCEDIDRASQALTAEVTRFNGYIGDASRTGARGSTREASWTVRIPSARFDAFLGALSSIGELQSSTRSAQDISEEYYDVEARLKNKKVEEARLVNLLQRATGNLSQVLQVERELSRVRGEIERVEGRLRYLSHQTEMSTVTVTLREVRNYKPEGPPTLASQIKRSFTGSIDALAAFVTATLLFVVAITPWLILPLIILAVLARRNRAQRRKLVIKTEDHPNERAEE